MVKRALFATGVLAAIVAGAVRFQAQTPAAPSSTAGAKYDLLLKGGHVIDARNSVDAVRDVAIAGGKIALVAASIPAADAGKTIDVTGLYVTPGLIDIHAHVYTGTGERNSYAGDNSVAPDGFTFRVGVTTVADAGGSGWRNFEDFKDRIIDRSKTRVLAFLNIVGNGMRGGKFESDQADMDAQAAAAMALKHKGTIVGIKTAHYTGPEWTPVEHAVEAGTAAGIPVMVDFGNNHPDTRPLADLLTKKLRPGDIYTHMYSGLRNELVDGKPNPGMIEGRKRGVIFDVGHGGGSFAWRVAMPMVKAGFIPDSISTDLHITSMNAGMKDMLNVMDKCLAMGIPLPKVIAMSTWHPAREIKQDALGHLGAGAIADIAVLRLEKGRYGYLDMFGAKLSGTERLTAEMTLKDGKIVYELNGLGRPEWTTLPADYTNTGAPTWDATRR